MSYRPDRISSRRKRLVPATVLCALALCLVISPTASKPAEAQTYWCGGGVLALNPGNYTLVVHGEVYCNAPTQYIWMDSNWYTYSYTTGQVTWAADNPQWNLGESYLTWTDSFSGSPWLRYNQICGVAVPVGGVGYYACPGAVGWF